MLLTLKNSHIAAQIATVFKDFPRNPAYKNSGKFVTLAEFLEFAKAKGASGILINIQVSFFFPF